MSKLKYVPSLTGMRGAAALYVVGVHLWSFGIIPPILILTSGWSGVNFFFVLSAYLLASLYSDVNARYFIRRIFRTFPLYYLTLPLYIVVGGIIAFTPWWLIYAQNFFVTSQIGPQWTLCLEELFYFLCLPILFKFRNALGKHWVKVFLVMTAMAGIIAVVWGNLFSDTVNPNIPYDVTWFWMRQMPYYFVDYLIGFTLSGMVISPRIRKWFIAPIAVVFFLYCGYTLGGNDEVVWGSTLYGIAYALIIVGFEYSRIFSNRVMELLGKWSYGIYLFHVPFLLMLGLWGVPMTIIVSGLMYYGFEKRFVLLGNILIKRTTKYDGTFG